MGCSRLPFQKTPKISKELWCYRIRIDRYATVVKRKHCRPPKPNPQIPSSKPRTPTAAKNLTTRPRKYPRSLNNEIVSRQMIDEINVEREKSDRLTVTKLNAVKQFNKQDHKSKLMTEKYSLLPLNPQQLTPVQTAIQRMSEKHLDFEIEPVNIIRPPEIEYTQLTQALVPIDTPLSIIHKHIPPQSDVMTWKNSRVPNFLFPLTKYINYF